MAVIRFTSLFISLSFTVSLFANLPYFPPENDQACEGKTLNDLCEGFVKGKFINGRCQTNEDDVLVCTANEKENPPVGEQPDTGENKPVADTPNNDDGKPEADQPDGDTNKPVEDPDSSDDGKNEDGQDNSESGPGNTGGGSLGGKKNKDRDDKDRKTSFNDKFMSDKTSTGATPTTATDGKDKTPSEKILDSSNDEKDENNLPPAPGMAVSPEASATKGCSSADISLSFLPLLSLLIGSMVMRRNRRK